MKPLKSFISVILIVLFYSYVVIFFKIFGLESSFSYFHWILLLITYIGIGVYSYYPLRMGSATFISNFSFFTSISYIVFLLSSILCAVQEGNGLVGETTRQGIYLVNIIILFVLLFLSGIAANMITRYKKSLQYMVCIFITIVAIVHFSLLYMISCANITSFYNTLLPIKELCLFIAGSLYTAFLIRMYFCWYKFSPKIKGNMSSSLFYTLITWLLSLILYINLMSRYHSLFFNFSTLLLALTILFICMKSSDDQFGAYINSELALHRKNSLLMNKYYEKSIHDQELLHTQYHQMDSIYQQMLAFYPDAFFVILDFNICETNEFGMNLLEVSEKNSLIGEDLLNFIPATYHTKLQMLTKNLCLYDTTPVSSDFELITTSGNTLYVEGSFILTDLYDAPTIMVSIRDLSSHKETYELQRQIEMEKLKVEFFSTISHELRTPVNIISSAAQLQSTLIKNGKTSELETYTQMISHNCLRLLRLLNNLLDISRIESNYFTVRAEDLNIVTLSESILNSIIPYARRKNITPIFDTDEEDLYCYLDPELFERILLNLLSNAVKYGVDDGHIYMTLNAFDTYVEIHIKDDGIGIPKEKLGYIFNRFMRVDNGLIRNAEGSGIGLSLAKSLVEKNNGTIKVVSSMEHGTEFTITFPLSKPPTLVDESISLKINNAKIELEFSDVFSFDLSK